MIAGIVSGSCVGLAWFVIFCMWLLKQHKKKIARRKDPAKVALRDVEALRDKTGHTTFIIPPDPAVITGQRKPGESAFQDKPRPESGEGDRLEDVTEGDEVDLSHDVHLVDEAIVARDMYGEHAGRPHKILKGVLPSLSAWRFVVAHARRSRTIIAIAVIH